MAEVVLCEHRETSRQLGNVFDEIWDSRASANRTLSQWKSLHDTLIEAKRNFMSTQRLVFECLGPNEEALSAEEEKYDEVMDRCTDSFIHVRTFIEEMDAKCSTPGGQQSSPAFSQELSQIFSKFMDLPQCEGDGGSTNFPQQELSAFNGEYCNGQSFYDTYNNSNQENKIDQMELWEATSFGDQSSQQHPMVKSQHTDTVKCPMCSSAHQLFHCVDFKDMPLLERQNFVIECPKCSEAHQLYQCDAFKALSYHERRRVAFNKKVCYNCLRGSHVSGNCTSTSSCWVCQEKHHTLLHPVDDKANNTLAQTPSVQQVVNSVFNQNVKLHHSAIHNRVLLPTVIVKILDLHGNQQDCHILIDIGGAATNVQSFHTTGHLDQLLGRFLDAENVPKLNAKVLTPEEQFAEEHFVENVRRDHTGRYQVRLPIKLTHPERGKSKYAALHRLRVMEKKFDKDPVFHKSNVEFMKEYLEMDHMELVPAAGEYIEHTKCYVIPYMAVLRPTSTTTKQQVGFDASSRIKPNNRSLNYILAVAPTIQPHLVSQLLNYPQVVVALEDRQYQRILWRKCTRETIKTYNLSTVTYGEDCAPFLGVRVLHQVAQDNEKDFPIASQTIQKGFYMDDLLSGAETLQEAISLRHCVQTILAKSGFRLRKWSSKSPTVLREIPAEDLALTPDDVISCSKSITALGLLWSPGSDIFSLAVEGLLSASTKRKLCSAAARIFDGLGIISSVTAGMKMIFQQFWSCDIDWDDRLPNSIINEFNCIRGELDSLQNVELPRFIPKVGTNIELHGFSGVSEKRNGAVIYSRGINQHGNMTVRHLIAKSRVAPLKRITIPRLELCAALLLTRLIEKVKEVYFYLTITMTAWSDSSIVLFWLQHYPSRWKTYVAIRSAEILDTIQTAKWRHVASSVNPADCISRGLTPKEILHHILWWSGPYWLVEASDQWPQSLMDLPGSILTREDKPLAIYSHLALRLLSKLNTLFFKFSNVRKLFRKVVYRLRIRRNFLSCKLSGSLSVEELNYARHHLIKIAQGECFPDDLKNLRKGKQVKRSSRLCTLLPFLDFEGIIRVTGRIQHSKFGPETRHPILLFRKHPLTRRLIEDAHNTNCHAQSTVTQDIMSGRYWIISERTSIKSVVLSRCIKCFFENPKPSYLDKYPHRLTRWNCLEHLAQEYWSHWHTEYFTSLQQRPKWMTEKMKLEPGDLVLVNSVKTRSWEMGRIKAVHSGSQEAVRVATVRMKGGLTTRAVNKMAKLPIDDTPEPVQEEDVELPQPGEDVP